MYDEFNYFIYMNKQPITEDLLLQHGFKYVSTEDEVNTFNKVFCIDNYAEYMYDTFEQDGFDNNIIINIQRGVTNNNAEYHVHVDNNTCCTIGSADISYIEQFNMLMEIFESKFKL